MQTEEQQAATQDRVLSIQRRINALAEEISDLASPDLTPDEDRALLDACDALDRADNALGMAFT